MAAMTSLYIPPPTAEGLAHEWALQMAREHKIFVSVTIKRKPPAEFTATVDLREGQCDGDSQQ